MQSQLRPHDPAWLPWLSLETIPLHRCSEKGRCPIRIAGQLKSGFFPAPEEAVDEVLRWLVPPSHKTAAILDPCAGKGAALLQLASGLRMTPWAIELDSGRAETLRASWRGCNEQESRLLAPASIFGCRSQSGQGFGMIWLNPPYDDELGGGGREEQSFLQHVTSWLGAGGVMALAVPARFKNAYSPINSYLHMRYDRVTWLPYPAAHRKFNEIVIFGVRRRVSRPTDEVNEMTTRDLKPHDKELYQIPDFAGPLKFWKAEPTQDELQAMLAKSPLNRLFTAVPPRPMPRPPLPLNKGHIALMLASGHLDGIVAPDGEPPHLIRGTARKQQYLKETIVHENEDGSTTTREVYAEKITLVVRALAADGAIRTLE